MKRCNHNSFLCKQELDDSFIKKEIKRYISTIQIKWPNRKDCCISQYSIAKDVFFSVCLELCLRLSMTGGNSF